MWSKKEEERREKRSVSCWHISVSQIHVLQIIQLLSIFPAWSSAPMCLPNHTRRLLALTSDACDACHKARSHTNVAGVWYALFYLSEDKQHTEDRRWFQTSLSEWWRWTDVQYDGGKNTVKTTRRSNHNPFIFSSFPKSFVFKSNQTLSSWALTGFKYTDAAGKTACTCNQVFNISVERNSLNVIPTGNIFP